MFWKTSLSGVLYYALSFVIVPIVVIVLVTVVTIAVGKFIIRRSRKKKALQEQSESSDT